jgi:hypothetical protein
VYNIRLETTRGRGRPRIRWTEGVRHSKTPQHHRIPSNPKRLGKKTNHWQGLQRTTANAEMDKRRKRIHTLAPCLKKITFLKKQVLGEIEMIDQNPLFKKINKINVL